MRQGWCQKEIRGAGKNETKEAKLFGGKWVIVFGKNYTGSKNYTGCKYILQRENTPFGSPNGLKTLDVLLRNNHVKGFFAPLKPKLDTAPPMFDFNVGLYLYILI